MTTTAADDHSDDLAEFGYKQELDRSIGRFASFAAGVSYISILTGTFQLFYFGFAFGGPAYWWTWPMVFFGQVMVALCFAELAANFPVAGSIYNWAKRMGSATVAWLGGWMMLTASIVTIAAVAVALQITLPQIWSGFQIYGDGSGKYDAAANAVILGTVLITFTTVVNALGVKLMSRINSTGVFIELIAAVLLIILLAANITRGPDVLFETQGTGEGHDWGYFGAFLTAALASAYVMYGFDTASSLGEETKDPRRTAPHRHHARRHSVLRAGRPDPAVRDPVGQRHQLGADRRRRPPVRDPRRARRHGRQGLPGLRRDRHHGLLPGRAHRDDPDGLRHGARQQPARGRADRDGPPQDQDADRPGCHHRRARDRSSWSSTSGSLRSSR